MLGLCHGNVSRLGFLDRYLPATLGSVWAGVLGIALAIGLTATAAAANRPVTTTILTVTAASGNAANVTAGSTIITHCCGFVRVNNDQSGPGELLRCVGNVLHGYSRPWQPHN